MRAWRSQTKLSHVSVVVFRALQRLDRFYSGHCKLSLHLPCQGFENGSVCFWLCSWSVIFGRLLRVHRIACAGPFVVPFSVNLSHVIIYYSVTGILLIFGFSFHANSFPLSEFVWDFLTRACDRQTGPSFVLGPAVINLKAGTFQFSVT
jgi:hypothetical protein